MATETNLNKVQEAKGGVYRHPDTGEEIVSQATSKFGNPQAAAYMRLGFVYVGPVSANSGIEAAKDPSRKPLADTSPSNKTVSELEAELSRAKEREAAAQRTANEKSDLVDQKEAEKEAETVKQDQKDAVKNDSQTSSQNTPQSSSTVKKEGVK